MRSGLIRWLVAGVLMFPAGAMANSIDASLDLSPYEDYYQGETIEVPSGEIETLYIHLSAEPGLYHIAGTSFHYEVLSGLGSVTLLDQSIEPSIEIEPCTWMKFGTIQVTGQYCTTVKIEVDLTLQQPIGTIWSNPIYKHIIPEPATMLLLVGGIGGILLKRRRS